jgi:photosystem II stability/assembly factor-like uncharacterized protein
MMRYKWLILIIILSLWVIAFSQNPWMSQNSGTSSILQSVFFVNQSHGWIAGAGPILHTSDGGQTWVAQNSPPVTGFYVAIYFVDEMNGWACGNEGKIIHTADGGNTWTDQPTPYTYPNPILYDIYFTNADTGWAVGGDHGSFPSYTNHRVILYTTNGGNSWDFQLNASEETPLTSVSFSSSTDGYAAAEWGGVVHTSNGGNTWVTKTSISTYDLYGIYFADSMNGWASGEYLGVPHVSSIHKTTDGGNSWQTQTFATDEYLRDIYFVDALEGWAVGGTIGGSGGNQHTTIFHTTDGGTNWQMQNSPSISTLLGLSFTDENHGWAVGVNGTVLTTSTSVGIESHPALSAPTGFALSQNYPNPFNPSTQIEYRVASNSVVKITIYSSTGQKVKTLVNRQEGPGDFSATWFGKNDSGNDVSSGIYAYKFQAGAFTQTRKMILMR